MPIFSTIPCICCFCASYPSQIILFAFARIAHSVLRGGLLPFVVGNHICSPWIREQEHKRKTDVSISAIIFSSFTENLLSFFTSVLRQELAESQLAYFFIARLLLSFTPLKALVLHHFYFMFCITCIFFNILGPSDSRKLLRQKLGRDTRRKVKILQ